MPLLRWSQSTMLPASPPSSALYWHEHRTLIASKLMQHCTSTSELPLRQTGIALEPKAAVQAEKEVTTFKKYF